MRVTSIILQLEWFQCKHQKSKKPKCNEEIAQTSMKDYVVPKLAKAQQNYMNHHLAMFFHDRYLIPKKQRLPSHSCIQGCKVIQQISARRKLGSQLLNKCYQAIK